MTFKKNWFFGKKHIKHTKLWQDIINITETRYKINTLSNKKRYKIN